MYLSVKHSAGCGVWLGTFLRPIFLSAMRTPSVNPAAGAGRISSSNMTRPAAGDINRDLAAGKKYGTITAPHRPPALAVAAPLVVPSPRDVIGAPAIAEPIIVVVAAVDGAAMGVTAGKRASLHGTQGVAVAIAEPGLMVVAAIGDTAMGVAARSGAVLYRAQGVAGAIAVTARVVIAAVRHAIVGVAAAGGAVVVGTDGNLSRGAASAAVVPMTVSQSRDCQQYRAQGAHQTGCQKLLHSHCVNISFQFYQSYWNRPCGCLIFYNIVRYIVKCKGYPKIS